MKKRYLGAALVLWAVLVSSIATVYARDPVYFKNVERLYARSRDLKTYVTVGRIEYDAYRRWYKLFTRAQKDFEDDLTAAAAKSGSCALVRQGIEQFVNANDFLLHADYAHRQAKVCDSLKETKEAQGFRDAKSRSVTNALIAIRKGMELMREAYLRARAEW